MIVSISDLSATSVMDVNTEIDHVTTYLEEQQSLVKQREQKRKSHRNRKLQRYRRKLRKQGRILEATGSLSAESVDPSVSSVLEESAPSNTGEHHSIQSDTHSFILS